jgi:hypothetical protein
MISIPCRVRRRLNGKSTGEGLITVPNTSKLLFRKVGHDYQINGI